MQMTHSYLSLPYVHEYITYEVMFKTIRPNQKRRFKPGVHRPHGEPKKIWGHNLGSKLICFNTFKGCFIKETSKTNKIRGFKGNIKSFRGPHLARWPYVVHACFKQCLCLYGAIQMINNT